MAEKEDNQIKITIFGQEYSVKAPADPTYIKKIAEYVDTKMREVQSGFSSTQSSNRIAILSAMNITDELFNAKKRGDSDNNEIEEKITSLIELIDESV
ncbi:MAG: cell division protein ZapA [Candidatus Neomarinimicrobiota bacterium]|jgi:cell division protein ZapA|uniref:Cell division protein ZapA n=1 Tax=marine metagenome TaxID=408172 RepID=A0A381W476_9ZZZZ|nr:cell division protein ZapA [Candidatus Neomarinimicrobiota bacterium]MEE3152682.1 cell division protein ZapA [Candidatus Neomarinimicrobiota bacterium]|tara:strand:- start:1148 stop:1441 length:294 start_codon:yes stop_codon:yes gene_type:complete